MGSIDQFEDGGGGGDSEVTIYSSCPLVIVTSGGRRDRTLRLGTKICILTGAHNSQMIGTMVVLIEADFNPTGKLVTTKQAIGFV